MTESQDPTPDPAQHPRPLAGFRVVDLATVLAGPFATYQLALLGAEVVKVESPAGDLARQLGAATELNRQGLGASFLAQNAQKRSITVDLKTESGKAVFRKLLEGADALVENFRPGVLARLGFDEDELRRINPKLVYCAVSGFGTTGPLRDRPAYDQIIQSGSGMMSVTGTTDAAPLRAGYPIADTLVGLAAAMAVSSALAGRERTGRGAMIDVSMLETAVTALGWVVSNYLTGGHEQQPIGNENGTAAPSGVFETADGPITITANQQAQYEKLCALLERPELATDPRFAERERRRDHRAELTAELEKTLRERSADHWEEQLNAVGVPASRVRTVPQMLASEQIRSRGLVHELPFPGGARADPLQVLGHGVHIDGHPAAPDLPPPLLGEHTDEILTELGFSGEDTERLRREGAV